MISWLFCILSIIVVTMEIVVFGDISLLEIYNIRVRGVEIWIERRDFFGFIFSFGKDFLNPLLVFIAVFLNSRILYFKVKQINQ